VQQEIEQIATALDLLEEHAASRTSVKTEYEDGVQVIRPKTEKVKPSYTVMCYRNGKWTTHITRSKKLENFRSAVERLLRQFQPDFIRVATYRNDNRNPQKSGEEIYTITVNEQAPTPPELDYMPVLKEEKNQNHPEPENKQTDFDSLPAGQNIRYFMEQCDKLRQEVALGKLEFTRNNLESQYQIKLMEKETALRELRKDIQHQMENLKRDYDQKVRECEAYRGEAERLNKEQQKSEDEIEDLLEQLDDAEAKIEELKEEIAEMQSTGRKVDKALNFGSLVLAGVVKKYADGNPAVQKTIQGIISDLQGMGDEEPALPDKTGGAVIEEAKQPETTEEKFQQSLCDWVRSIEDLEGLKLLASFAECLSTGAITRQQLRELVNKSKEHSKI